MRVSATAYSGDSTTSTLTRPHWGVIAVDPSVIPYGSIVYIKEFDNNYYYNFKAEEGEENQYYTLNFLVGEYSSLVNTLKKVENLISENEKENIR